MDEKAPSSNTQAPEKSQAPTSKPDASPTAFAAWDLRRFWLLELGIWSFSQRHLAENDF
jgi:hypothetical protein